MGVPVKIDFGPGDAPKDSGEWELYLVWGAMYGVLVGGTGCKWLELRRVALKRSIRCETECKGRTT